MPGMATQQSTPVRLPPGVSEDEFAAAVERFESAIGPDKVLRAEEELLGFRDPFQYEAWTEYSASAVVMPTTVEEVQAVVRVAGERRIPLWTHSRGMNNGYGGPAPRLDGSVIVSLRNMDKVLEIGSGCGYQTAVLAQFAREVYSIERVGPLLTRTRTRLRQLRLNNVRLKHADGLLGLPESAPFDGIIFTAAATHIPGTLLEQLAIRGRIVFPKGSQDQYLCVIERNLQGYTETMLDEVRFVPIVPGIWKR